MKTCTLCNIREIDPECQVELLKDSVVKGHGCICKVCYDEFVKNGVFVK